MSYIIGNTVKLSIFGESHGKAVGVTIDGIPSGKEVNLTALQVFLNRRAPGNSSITTGRKEKDVPELLSGIKLVEAADEGVDIRAVTTGAPIAALIYNENQEKADYRDIKYKPRPGHADYTAYVKYKGFNDEAGGGHFSGRLTAPLCIAGGICKQLLEEKGVTIEGKICSVQNSDKNPENIKKVIETAKDKGDSVGGIIEVIINGVPPGLGEPMFGGIESRISQAAFGIPAVKGIEFGLGFQAARLLGSENNDSFNVENGRVITESNNCGGILGGISTGMPIVFRAAVKPTPSIGISQKTVDLTTMQPCEIKIDGRHDPSIVPRAVAPLEAAAAIIIYDMMLSEAML